MSAIAGTLKEAKRHGIVKYVGEPCCHCGGVVRYTASKSCVACTKANLKKRREAKKAAALHDPTASKDHYEAALAAGGE